MEVGRSSIDLTGQKIGLLKVIGLDTHSSYKRWICECKCGSIVSMEAKQIKAYGSCGCVSNSKGPAIQRSELHELYVIQKLSIRKICDATGLHRNTISKYIEKYNLRQERLNYVSPAKALQRKITGPKPRKLAGKRFGLLEVVEYTGEKQDGKPILRCKCDCGKEVNVLSSDLYGLKVISCGCTEMSYGRSAIGQFLIEHNIEFKYQYKIFTGVSTYLLFDFAIFKDGMLDTLIDFTWDSNSRAANKDKFCKSHGFRLLRVKFKHRSRINEVLHNFFLES